MTVHWLFWGVALLACTSLFVVVVVQAAAGWALRSANRQLPERVAGSLPVSILKPIKGADGTLEENLEAFSRQDYFDFELILGIEDVADPAVTVARRFARNHPELAIQVVIGAPPIGLNPKVNNLTYMARFARHELWLVSDADVLPEPGHLSRLVSEWSRTAGGLVHSMLVGRGERSFGALLESMHLNTFVACTIWGASVAQHNCVIGKSMLFHKSLLAEVGGWRVLENVLAEDYVLGRLIQQRGRKVKLCLQPLVAQNPERTLASFINRHVRWAQMRRRVSLLAYVCESTSNPIAWLCGLTVLVASGMSPMTLTAGFFFWVCAFIAVKCFSDELMARSLRPRGLGVTQLLLVPFKDLLIAVLWFVGLLKRQVNWRGNTLFIGRGSQLSRSANERLAADET